MLSETVNYLCCMYGHVRHWNDVFISSSSDVISTLGSAMALNSLFCADVPLSNYSRTHSLFCRHVEFNGERCRPLSVYILCVTWLDFNLPRSEGWSCYALTVAIRFCLLYSGAIRQCSLSSTMSDFHLVCTTWYISLFLTWLDDDIHRKCCVNTTSGYCPPSWILGTRWYRPRSDDNDRSRVWPRLYLLKCFCFLYRVMCEGWNIMFVELAGLPAPPTSHTLHLYPFHLSLPFPSPNYTAGDLEILPGLS